MRVALESICKNVARRAAVPLLFWSTLLASVFCALAPGARAWSQSTTLVISGQNGVLISGLTISTTSGDCIDIVNSSNVTIQSSRIGPCGTNNSSQNSRGIAVTASAGVNIYDNYVHVENIAAACDHTHDGILVFNSPGQISILGNVIAYNERNVVAYNSSNVSVVGNFLLNPRGAAWCSNPANLGGPQFQSWADSTSQPNNNITLINNYLLSSSSSAYPYPGNQSDAINFGVTNGMLVENNYVVGGTYRNGCGITVDYAANTAQIIGNVVSNTGNCGIGIASGVNHIIDRNKVLVTNPVSEPAGDVGISVWNQNSVPCGPVTVSNNLSYEQQPTGWMAGFWYGGGCGALSLINNTWDGAAYQFLNPISATNPPPLVPPQPYACVAVSPYSTQTGKSWCPTG